MIEFKIVSEKNPNVKYLRIYEGNINLEKGIRFLYALLDEDKNVLEKRLFIINDNDFFEIGKSEKKTNIAIVNLLIEAIGYKLVDELV